MPKPEKFPIKTLKPCDFHLNRKSEDRFLTKAKTLFSHQKELLAELASLN